MSNLIKRATERLSDNSPHILTGLGAAGVIGTAYLAHRVSGIVTTDLMLEEIAAKRSLTAKEKVDRYWKSYIPVIIVGAASITLIITSNIVSTRRNLAVLAAASLSEIALQEFRAKAIEVVGPGKEQKIRDEIARDKATEGFSEMVLLGDGNVHCFDTFSGRHFESNVEKLRKAQNDINLECINHSPASLNDFYSLIGLASISVGDTVGWNTDNVLELVFSPILIEDKPVVAIGYRNEPTTRYDRPFG